MLTVLSIFSLAQVVSPLPISPSLDSPAPAPPPVVQASPPAQMPPLIQTPPPTQTVPSAPAPPPPRQVEVIRPQEVRSLPGQLDAVPVFNSNSPEVIQEEGILVSAFPPAGMEIPEAHLNFPLEGRFDLFAHHIARGADPDDTRTLFLGMIVHNPGDEAVTLDVLQAVSYLSQDAPFIDLPSYVANPLGTVFAGPGSRAVNDILRGQRQTHWPAQVIIPPGENHLLMNAPIPLRRLTVATDGTLPPGYIIPPPPNVATPTTASTSLSGGLSSDSLDSNDSTSNSTTTVSSTNQVVVSPRPPAHRDVPINGRSTLMHLSSSGQVYVASLAMYAPKATGGAERVPTLVEWEELLKTSDLAGPRDRTPTSPDTSFFARFLYGRVAGIAQGSQWTALATDSPDVDYLSIPKPGEEFSYVISTVDHNTFGTEQIQSAPMLVRYPDTAYRAHGNYGVKYDISLPLYNTTESTQRVSVLFQTPIQDEDLEGALRFREPPDPQVFFRGTVRLRFTDNLGIPQTRYLHVVQHRGQQGDPLIQLVMPSGDRRLVEVQFIYPPDATPPQVITVQTMQDPNIIEVSN